MNREVLRAALETPPKPFRETVADMSDEELVELYTGKNVQRRNMAVKELENRYPDTSVIKVLEIHSAAQDVDTEPSEGRKEAGNYKKGHFRLMGMPVSIENPAGSMRRGTDKNGEQWEVEMPVHYGYLKKTKGADGDHIDVFIGPNPQSDKVFVIDQVDGESGEFDEHKCLIGFDTIQDAIDAYDNSYSDDSFPRMGGMDEMTVSEFKEWVKSGNNKKPINQG